MMQPFRIGIADAEIADLRERLARTRWPSASPREPWRQGTELAYLQELVAYWKDRYDWRRHEASLNEFAQYSTGIDGQRLHFIHERSPHPRAVPLLIVHGWPGSVYEFHKILPLLTHPDRFGGDARDAFHVVAPSLPGYGWSAPPDAARGTPRAFGGLFAQLMRALGYARYAVQGGDWGSVIAGWLALDHSDSVMGLHLNMAGLRPYAGKDASPLTEEEQAFLNRAREMRKERFAYQEIQGTRPQSLGYGLTDSPAGLAGWIVEKFRDWSDCGGDVERRFSKDELLTNIMIYWWTRSMASSVRLYWEHRHSEQGPGPGQRVIVPTAYADFPAEILPAPRSWLERVYRLERYTKMPRGGHFAALEEPELLVQDVREFLRTRRS
jgi:pimeloyl-ACP methyl ester carboxylesterase